ncbi:MAG: DinB family protein [Actinomycetes bacterium]
MTWISPAVDRQELPQEGDERMLLTAFLEFQRETFLWKCSGLSPAQLVATSVSTTGMTLLGLIRHLTDVERHWLRNVAVGDDIAFLYWDNPGRDSDFEDVNAADAERDYDRFIAELGICRSNQALDLDASIETADRDPFTFRWILIHLIEEYARHNGHADLIREAIDGATGE